MEVDNPLCEALITALAAALPSNSTLRELSLMRISFSAAIHLSPVLLALGKNRGIKALQVDVTEARDGSLWTAIKDRFARNETLESLELNSVPLCDANADLWCRPFSFLCTNKALKSLVVEMQRGVTSESCLSALRIDIVAMLQDSNISLESLSIKNGNDIRIKAEKYFVLVAALQHNTTLQSLRFHTSRFFATRVTEDERKQMASLLKKNYALERLPDIDLKSKGRAILRLNAAGRRYLMEDGSSISKGVEVLSRVNHHSNCVFLHLLENPKLCDRRAVSYRCPSGLDGIAGSQ
jgi:hypothetical protein